MSASLHHRRRAPSSLLGASFVLLSLFSGPSRADFDVSDTPPLAPSGRPRFEADAATLLGPDGPEVVLAMQVPYRELFFEPHEEGFRARLDLILVLYDGKRQVAGDLWPITVDVAKKAETKSSTMVFRKALRLASPPGRLRAEVTVDESRTGRRSKLEWDLEVPDYAREPLAISTLWVIPCADEDSSATDASAGVGSAGGAGNAGAAMAFPPTDWVLGHRYGELLGPLCIVGVIYQSDGGGPVDLTWKIFDGRRAEVQRGDMTLTGGERVPFRIRPDYTALWLGRHSVELVAKSAGREARRSFDFQMDHSAVSLTANHDESIEAIRMIAGDATVDSIAALDGLPRKEAWNRFWADRDPSPGTPDNEFRDQFFARLQFANESFSVLEPGWRSDRGRTYILYGAPDTVEEHPHEIDGPGYIVWNYDRLNRRFVFVDYDGFGRYEYYRPGR